LEAQEFVMISVLDATFWEKQFAVTDGDVERLHSYLCECEEPQEAIHLLECVVGHKLQEVSHLDPIQRAKSEAAAAGLLQQAGVYHPTAKYAVGQRLFVAKKESGKWRIGLGTVATVRPSHSSHYESFIDILIDGTDEKWCFIAGLDPKHPWNKQFKDILSNTSQLPEQIIEVYGGTLLPHLLGRLTQDSRFVHWGNLWWTGAVVPPVKDITLQEAHLVLLRTTLALTLDDLLQVLLPDRKMVGNAERFALYQALVSCSDRFENVGTEQKPRYRPLLPNLAQKVEELRQAILGCQMPIKLDATVSILFPNLADSPESWVAIAPIVENRLDQRFIRVAPNLLFLDELLVFDTDGFEDVFGTDLVPLATRSLIYCRLFPHTEHPPKLSRPFQQRVKALLGNNPVLTKVTKDYWLPRSAVPNLLRQAVAVLEGSDQPLDSSEIVVEILSDVTADREQMAALANLLNAEFRETPQVLALSEGQWLYESALTRALDKTYGWLLKERQPRSIGQILSHIFGLSPTRAPGVEVLAERFGECLRTDLRFLFDGLTDKWQASPPGPSGNLPAYHVLWEQRRPLSDDALAYMVRDRFPTVYPDFTLADDNRFRLWRGDKWGLSRWLDINDWAYEYLREKEMVLLPTTIVLKMCEQHRVAPDVAIFTPEDDPRFVRRPHGRWYYRHTITDVELDRMLKLLYSVGEGLALDELVLQTVGLDTGDTDAVDRLTKDERFACVGDQWFAKDKIFYTLSDEDVEQLLGALCGVNTGLRLATFVKQVLNREARLTDAEARLRADSRFREILPGVWAAADLHLPSAKRTPIFNRPIRSEKISVISNDEYTMAEELTVRKRQPTGETVLIQQMQVTRTLSLLDVRHGNLIVDRAIAGLLPPDDEPAIHLTDELGNEFVGWVDGDDNLLQGLGRWFEARQLTFGDKIVVKATDQIGFLEIQPKNQRDERVYQEALQRQDVEKLIEGAQQTCKSYHDLMIEVMEYFNQSAGEPVPLHREDIYNLVNYNRTANRNYIFSLLSLSHCPYEELRYLVPHGRGYWSYDPERRKAFEMKMKELLEQVGQLEAENERLQQSVASAQVGEVEIEAEVSRVEQQNAELLEANRRLEAVHNDQLDQIKELNTQVSALRAQVAEQAAELEILRSGQESLQGELADTQEERDRLQGSQEEQAHQIEKLIREKGALEEDVAVLQDRVEQLASQNTALQEDVDQFQGQVEALTSENTALKQEYEQHISTLRSQMLTQRHEYENRVESFETRQKELQNEIELERGRGRKLQERLEALEKLSDARDAEVDQLGAKVDQVQVALRTPLGKGFVALTRLLGGPDLSDL
jgi:FtsZ-binding cell division protein ZapB